MEEQKRFSSKGLAVYIWFPYIFCLLLGAIDLCFSSTPSNATIYITMSNPIIFVCLLFRIHRKEIIRQNKKIEELEDKIKEIKA